MSQPTPEQLQRLAAWDTPTICIALEVLDPNARSAGYTIGHHVCADPSLPPIVGFARTATIRARGAARVLTIDKKSFLGGIHEDPSLAFRIVQTMSHRVRDLTDRLARYEKHE